MSTILAAVLLAVTGGGPDSTDVLVARIADRTEVSLSPNLASNPRNKWEMLDRTMGHLPWAREALARPDLIEGWQKAFKDCPLPRKGVEPGRFQNLLELLTYKHFVRKESGHERELLTSIIHRCKAAKIEIPEGPCVRFARVVYPTSLMAHLYDGITVVADGNSLEFSSTRAQRQYDQNKKRAKAEIVRLVGGA